MLVASWIACVACHKADASPPEPLAISECRDWSAKYRACTASAPPEARPAMEATYATEMARLKETAASYDGRMELHRACTKLLLALFQEPRCNDAAAADP